MNTESKNTKTSPIIVLVVIFGLLGVGFMGKLMYDMVSYMGVMTDHVGNMAKDVHHKRQAQKPQQRGLRKAMGQNAQVLAMADMFSMWWFQNA